MLSGTRANSCVKNYFSLLLPWVCLHCMLDDVQRMCFPTASYTPALSSFLTTEQWERNKMTLPFRDQQMGIFSFDFVFDCFKKEAKHSVLMLSPLNTLLLPRETFMNWSSWKTNFKWKGEMFLLNSVSEIAHFQKVGITFSSLLDF